MPTGDGFALLDHENGREDRRFDASAEGGEDAIGLSQVGDILYERRGGKIHAYKLLA